MDEIMEKLMTLGNDLVVTAVEQYTVWYFTHAVGWFIVGAVLILLGWKRKNYIFSADLCGDFNEAWNGCIRYLLGYFLMFFGIAIMIFNLCTIIAPKAYAIHNLINDLK
jgi:hypothetical protein